MSPPGFSNAAFGLTVLAIGLAAACFAWGVAHLGTQGLARYRERFTSDAHSRLREMFLFMDPARLYALHLALVLAVATLAWFISGAWPLAMGAGVAAVLLPRLALRWLRRRRLDQIEQQLPDALLVLAGSMKAGLSLAAGLQQLVRESRPPLAQEFDLLLREQRLGVSLDDALNHLDQRLPLQSITLAVAAMRIATETGGGLAEALERAAATLRAKLAMEGKIRALTAQGKLQAIVVGLLPVVLMLVLMKMEPHDMGKLFSTQLGWAVLAVLALLEFFGVVLIRKIVAIDV